MYSNKELFIAHTQGKIEKSYWPEFFPINGTGDRKKIWFWFFPIDFTCDIHDIEIINLVRFAQLYWRQILIWPFWSLREMHCCGPNLLGAMNFNFWVLTSKTKVNMQKQTIFVRIWLGTKSYDQHYSLGTCNRSNVCLYILSYMHDITIPTKDLGSGYQELQLWFFAPIDLWMTSLCTQWHLAHNLGFLCSLPRAEKVFVVQRSFPDVFFLDFCYNGKPHWKSEKYSE